MSVLDAKRHHEDLVEELIAEVGAYNPEVDRDLLRHAFVVAEQAHEGQTRRSGEEFIHHPLGVARICAELHLDGHTIAAALLHDVVEDTGADLEEVRGAFGDEIAQLVEGVTKLTRISFQSREQAEAGELPEDDRRDGAGRARHPHQARRPPPQHADDRVPEQADAGAEGARDARGVRAARPPARDPRAQVGARGSRVSDAPPAEVRRDQGDGRRPARRTGGTGGEGRRNPGTRAGRRGRPRGHRGARKTFLLDLRQDGQARPRVQRDLRPDRDACHLRALRGRGGSATATRRSASSTRFGSLCRGGSRT